MDDSRFAPAGVLAPSAKADLAFVMHILSHMEDTAAIVCFNGVMYRGGAEREIRKYMLDYVDAVIQLPNKLFFGTSITTSILVLKKHKTDRKILFIDASKECEKKAKKYLTQKNIDNIVNEYKERKNSNVSYLADMADIENHNYNLYKMFRYTQKQVCMRVYNHEC